MSSAALPDIPDAVLDQAIGWLVRLQSGSADAQLHNDCLAWRQADPLHETAWCALQTSEAAFQQLATLPGLPGPAALDTLQRLGTGRQGRRQVLKLIAAGVIASAGGWGLRQGPLSELGADYATAVGERRRFLLSDGTRLQLNTDSAVDARFSVERRLIVLRRGELFIDTGTDADAPGGRREFWVQSRHARLQAIGTAFGVREDAQGTRLRVEEGVVAIHQDGPAIRVVAGEEYLIAAEGSQRIEYSSMNASAWTRGQLVVRRMRLGELVAELGRYRRGWLSCDPAVADLQVSGVFQLDDIDRTLVALADSLSVRVQRFTPLWSRVVAF